MSHVAVAIPAYNEAEGIAGFLEELDRELKGRADQVTFVVQNDCSTDGTLDELARVADELTGRLEVHTNDANSGHGPTVLNAYRGALATGADVIAQVDGDGQFHGRDLARLVSLAGDGALAMGVRARRVDPWFRKVLTRALRLVVRVLFGVAVTDANCPLRAFPAPALASFLDDVPRDALVPNIYLAALAHRRPEVMDVTVEHLERRATDTQGTMWGARRSLFIPKRLVLFSLRALAEVLGVALLWRAHGQARAR